MRTTVTLDPDVSAKLREIARERGVSFKQALNSTLRAGFSAGAREARPYRLPTYTMRLRPEVDLDKALRLAAALEDEAVAGKLELRK
jgi:hypothetical protein